MPNGSDSRARILRDRLEVAQTRLSKISAGKGHRRQRRSGWTMKRPSSMELSTQLSVAQVQTADTRSKQQTDECARPIADVMQNPVIMNLKTDIARFEARQKDLAGNLGKEPSTISARRGRGRHAQGRSWPKKSDRSQQHSHQQSRQHEQEEGNWRCHRGAKA